MGLEGSRRAGGVDVLCRVLAHAHCAWLARTAQRLFCAARLCAGHLHLAGREFLIAGSSLLRLIRRKNEVKSKTAKGKSKNWAGGLSTRGMLRPHFRTF